jgi:hypothetical protein
VRGELRCGQREDQPTLAGVDRPQPEDVGEERSIGCRVVGVEDRVDARDRHCGECLMASELWISDVRPA